MNYLNTKTSTILFEKAVKSKYYVDKSRMIETVCKNIRSEGQYICITRPRRFGKTVNANMLAAYLTKGSDRGVSEAWGEGIWQCISDVSGLRGSFCLYSG